MPDKGRKVRIPCPGHDGRGCSLGRGVSYGCTVCNGEGYVSATEKPVPRPWEKRCRDLRHTWCGGILCSCHGTGWVPMTTAEMLVEVSRCLPDGGLSWHGGTFTISDDTEYNWVTDSWQGLEIDDVLRKVLEDTHAV